MKVVITLDITTKYTEKLLIVILKGLTVKIKLKNGKMNLKNVSHRPYTSGFYLDKTNYNSQNYETSSYIRKYNYVGIVKEKKFLKILI